MGMKYLNMIVKGSRDQAISHAKQHGIPFEYRTTTRAGEIVGRASADLHPQAMVWFNNCGLYPEEGDLLFWSINEE